MNSFSKSIAALSKECGIEQSGFVQMYGEAEIKELNYVAISNAAKGIAAQVSCGMSGWTKLVAE